MLHGGLPLQDPHFSNLIRQSDSHGSGKDESIQRRSHLILIINIIYIKVKINNIFIFIF